MEARRERMDIEGLDVTHSGSEFLLVQTQGAEWSGRADRKGSPPGGDGAHHAMVTGCMSQQVSCLHSNVYGRALCHYPD